jgi:uncharacterized membrane protein YjgN (DUF898 family)
MDARPGTDSPSAAPAHQPSLTALPLAWAHPSGLPALSVTNLAYRLATLGLYHFWGRTEVRRRVWSAIRIAGEPLHYTGTGGELMVGFLIVLAAVILPTMLAFVAGMFVFGPESPVLGLMQIAMYAIFFVLYGVGIYRAQRYRLSRTRWRGIRGSVEGSPWRYAWTYVWTALLIPFTFGWIVPWRTNKLQKQLVNDMRFGNRPFRYTAGSRPLYERFLVVWLMAILIVGLAGYVIARVAPRSMEQMSPAVTLRIIGVLAVAYLLYAIIAAWYRSGVLNHFARSTTFETLSFRADTTAPGLVWLTITNYAIMLGSGLLVAAVAVPVIAGIILTLGLQAKIGMPLTSFMAQIAPLTVLLGAGVFAPIIQARTARYLIERMAIEGTIDVATIAQSSGADPRFGEGVAQAFDVDAF